MPRCGGWTAPRSLCTAGDSGPSTGGEPGSQLALHPARAVQHGHHAAAGTGSDRAGSTALEGPVEVQVPVDAPAGLAEARQPFLQGIELPLGCSCCAIPSPGPDSENRPNTDGARPDPIP